MTERVEYFSASMKNGGSFENKTFDGLLDAIAEYYFEPHDEDLRIEEIEGITLHVDDTEVPFPAKVIVDINEIIKKRVRMLQEQAKHELEHQRQESMGRL